MLSFQSCRNLDSGDHGPVTRFVIAITERALIELRLLGPLEIRTAEGAELHSLRSQPKRIGLLAFLAQGPGRGPCRRDSLLALFWPEADSSHARRALNQALYVIRQELGRDVFLVSGEEVVALNPGRLRCDAVTFENLLDRGEAGAALSLYRGPFLDGFHLDGCPDFDRWTEQERERLSRRAVDAALLLAQSEESASNLVGCVHWLREASRLAPYEQPVHRKLFRVLRDAGDRSGALRELEAFRRRLMSDLQLGLPPELEREADRLRKETAVPAAGFAALPISSPPAPLPLPASPAKRQPPWMKAAAAAAVVIGGLLYLSARVTGLGGNPGPPNVLVLPLENLTGDTTHARLGRIAAERIADDLARSGLASVISPAAVWREDRARLKPGTGFVLSGSVARETGRIVFRGEVTEAATGRMLRSVSALSPEAAPWVGIEALRRQLAGALASAVDPRLASWSSAASQPPSLEAYQLHVDGLDLLMRSQWREAAVLLERAARVDSGFTSPLLWAIYARQGTGGGYPRADSLVSALAPHRDRLPVWDRAMFDFLRGRQSGDQEAAYRAIRRVAELMPASEWRYLWAAQALYVNRPAETAAILRRLDSRENPLAGRLSHRWLTDALHRLGNYQDELEATWRARRAGLRVSILPELRSLAAMGRDREVLTILQRVLTASRPNYATGDLLVNLLAELRVHESTLVDSVTGIAIDWYTVATDEERREPTYRDRLGHLLMFAGRHHEARRLFEELASEWATLPADRKRLIPQFVYLGPLGVLAASRGDSSEAQRLSQAIASLRGRFDYGEGTVWRAAIAAELGDLAGGTGLFRQAMEEGFYLTNDLWTRPELARLRDYVPFQNLLRPR